MSNWRCALCENVNPEASARCGACDAERVEIPLAPTAPPLRPVPSPKPEKVGAAASGAAASSTGGAAPAPAAARRSGATRWIAAAVVLLLLGGGAFFVRTQASDDDSYSADQYDTSYDDSSSYDDTSSSDDPTTYDDTGADTSAVDVTEAEPPMTLDATRGGRLYAGEAVLRADPSLSGAELARYKGQENKGLEVLEEASASNGWYRVRVDGQEGYLFGAFVLPPAPGLCVGLAPRAPTYYDDFGSVIAAEGSGTKVLITSTEAADPLPVVMPGGQRAVVPAGDIEIVECG